MQQHLPDSRDDLPESTQDDVLVSQETAERPHKATPEQMDAVHKQAEKLIETLRHVPEGDLVGNILATSLKLLRDNTNRGDVKLIDKAVAELRYALKIFAPYRETKKVAVFGSARTHVDKHDYIAAVEFGKKMAEAGWMVTTGAGGGIMAAAHGGAGREPSFGLAIRLPFEQKTNEYIHNDKKLVHFKYFFTRKLMFVRSSHAIALFPGGFGTMDEGFEVLTLIQTGKAVPMPIVLVDKKGGAFWTEWQKYVENQLLARGMISEQDFNLYKVTDDVNEAIAEVQNFYRNYHSIRYVKNQLVIRLQRAPNEQQLQYLRDHFSDIKVSGDFAVHNALKAEADEVEIADLPRLSFDFNRRDHGKFRALIDYLNTF
ncbi:MAG: TIGR00730 family Rossman fold protein [Tepidisphaeraceae bacterium]